MSIPKITLTMLGANASGKTAFLLGMYMTLHRGIGGYGIITKDRDDHYDLRKAWATLNTQGEFPPPNGVDPIEHNFIFRYGFDPLLDLDVLDFRGNAGLESARGASASADVTQLRARLRKSDSVYIALDSEAVGQWIRRGCKEETTPWAEDIAEFGSYVSEAAQAQRKDGRPGISLVVLLTKADRLPDITGLSKGDASVKATDNLENLLEVAFYPGVTTLVCPIQLGNLGPAPTKPGQAHRIDPSRMDPRFLHKPVIFSLMHYLSEQVVIDSVRLERAEADQAAAREEVERLQNAYLGFGSWFNSKQIRDVGGQIDEGMRGAREINAGLASARERADQLMSELNGLPIIKDGKRL
jgi:hypothetical protein